MASSIFETVIERLCRWLCRNRLFNSDMSLEIDRLTALLEEKEAVNEH